MRLKRNLATVAAALTLSGLASKADAGSAIFPGITAGIPLGVPLPEGVYDAILPSYGVRNSTPRQDVWAGVPSWLIWSTPWTIAGGRVLLDFASPMADVNVRDTLHRSGFANPVIDAQLKWALGGGFFGGFQAGVYLPVKNEMAVLGIAHDFASFQAVGALTYLADGWSLSATAIYGTGQSGSATSLPGSYGPDWANIDLTATRKFGKFEFGAVAYGAADLSRPVPGYGKQSVFAVGGLAGYDFGRVNAQIKVTRDVSEANYGGYETRVWANLFVAVWAPAPPATTVAAKF